MPPIDRLSPVPAYRQIADELRVAISGGELAPGAKLPSERELGETYAVDRGVVRRALALLQAWGLVVTQHGRGAFVRARLRPPLRRVARNRLATTEGRSWRAFGADVEDGGLTPQVTTEIRRQPVPDEVAERLELPYGSEVVVRARRMGAGGQTLMLATSYFPAPIVERVPRLEQLDTGPGGAFTLLEEAGFALRQEEAVSARMPMPEEASALQLGPGTPVIRILRTIYDQNDQPVEACDMLLAADRNELIYHL
ncbi:MAG: GntR family transcriptional regulator [Egibacteraceae bacterium]